jgi:glycosyltransferase involved in cell wall biosynthesis
MYVEKAQRRLVHIVTVPQTLRFLEGHIRAQAAAGWDVHVVASPSPEPLEVERRIRAPIHRLKMERQIAPLSDAGSLVRLTRLLRQLQPDLVHCHSPKAGLLGTVAARLAGVPSVALSVFGLPQMARRGLMRSLLDTTTRISCALADWVWADSPSMRDYLAETRLCNAAKLHVLGQGSVAGIDAAERFRPDRFSAADRTALRERFGIPAEAFVLGFVGRVVRDKGILELIGAWNRLKLRYPHLHLVIAGPVEEKDPEFLSDLQALEHDPAAHCLGLQEDVPPILAMFDVFVNPSYREGFGVANAEASAMGLPVVATRIPGCVDSVADGQTGTLVPVRDVIALAKALERYLREPELRELHGNNGRERILTHFRPEDLSSALLKVYERLYAGKTHETVTLDNIQPACGIKQVN